MREYKFRGKRKDNKEWVFGGIAFGGEEFGNRVYITDPKVNDEGVQWFYEVILETVGQYTGLIDKNGKEIYEKDICNYREYECFGHIGWNDESASFYFYVVGGDEEQLYDYVDELKVIGNIHENPELLEEKMINWMVEGRKNGRTYVTSQQHTQYLISLEAIKIGRDYPDLTVEECLEKAKEIYSYDEN